MSITSLGDYLELAEHTFKEAGLYFGHGTDNPWDEAVAIARYVLQLPVDCDRTVLDRPLTELELKSLIQLMQRRIKDRIPLPYLIHEAWFAGLRFYVDERVIIPRSPLAELIERQFQPWVTKKKVKRILDLCTGSGCIAIACAYAFPEARIDAVDISLEALAVARKNVLDHHCEERLRLIHSDLFDACGEDRYDIIISNPPYVDRLDLENLPEEYIWEPKLALAAGEDGLQIVHRILNEAPGFISPEGILIVEVGNSEEALVEYYPKLPFTWLEFERGGQGVFLLNADDFLLGQKQL